jgi:hypothetical protein
MPTTGLCVNRGKVSLGAKQMQEPTRGALAGHLSSDWSSNLASVKSHRDGCLAWPRKKAKPALLMSPSGPGAGVSALTSNGASRSKAARGQWPEELLT